MLSKTAPMFPLLPRLYFILLALALLFCPMTTHASTSWLRISDASESRLSSPLSSLFAAHAYNKDNHNNGNDNNDDTNDDDNNKEGGIALKSLSVTSKRLPPCLKPPCKQLNYLVKFAKRPSSSSSSSYLSPSSFLDNPELLVGKRVTLTNRFIQGTIIRFDPAATDGLSYLFNDDQQNLGWIGPVQEPFLINPLQAPLSSLPELNSLSQSFFVWMALPSDKFWVNLNPSEPDRILDTDISQTIVGKILLESDRSLKNATAWSMHPDDARGDLYWQMLNLPFPTPQLCLSFRTWIHSSPVQLIENDDFLFITTNQAAPLDVSEESEYLFQNDLATVSASASGCAAPDTETQLRSEHLFNQILLPGLADTVQTSPAFAKLRYIYFWRIVAGWYQQHILPDFLEEWGYLPHQLDPRDYKAFSPSQGVALTNRVFGQYLNDVTHGAYNIVKYYKLDPKDKMLWTRRYTHGAIDLTTIVLNMQCPLRSSTLSNE